MNFASAFATASRMVPGVFVPVTATWPGVPALDSGGSIVTPGVATEILCRAQFDRVTEAMRASDDFLEADVRIMIPAAGLDRPITEAARIVVACGANEGIWSLRSVERDPAGVGYDCRGRKVA